ncbi:MAG: hypothetical protein D3916_18515, partial [Candidatus Electrothrix sp. MAN1_4]|nr:hypothetical protein [Candidatus Electrothrix sp. MAN1_4]
MLVAHVNTALMIPVMILSQKLQQVVPTGIPLIIRPVHIHVPVIVICSHLMQLLTAFTTGIQITKNVPIPVLILTLTLTLTLVLTLILVPTLTLVLILTPALIPTLALTLTLTLTLVLTL